MRSHIPDILVIFPTQTPLLRPGFSQQELDKKRLGSGLLKDLRVFMMSITMKVRHVNIKITIYLSPLLASAVTISNDVPVLPSRLS